MSIGENPFSDDSLRKALSAEAKSVSTSASLRQNVESMFSRASVGPVAQAGLLKTSLLTAVVAVVVMFAGYQIYSTFFYSPTYPPPDPEAVWKSFTHTEIPDGAGVNDLKKLTTSQPVAMAVLTDVNAQLASAYANEFDCNQPHSPVIEYRVGTEKITLITMPDLQHLATKEGSNSYQNTFGEKQVVAQKRDSTWVIVVASKTFPTSKLQEIVQSASISKTTAASQPSN